MAKYGKMLQLLRQEVQAPTPLQGEHLMPIIMTAVIIESVATPSWPTAGFHAHIGGLAQIIERLGPEAFQRRPNILVFEVCRCFIIGKAIIHKQNIFLADDEWKTTP